ncbi:MAG TPA: hypothetical protein VGB30_02395 [bacterium]|jgi:hypothetical protein
MNIELIYDNICPNVEAAREVLSNALEQSGLPGKWDELNKDDGECPKHAKYYGSPTILVNGKDVAGLEPDSGMDCCRIYDHGEDGMKGIPTVDMIISAIQNFRE